MKVAIRADASPHIGSGHFMRCLCLADELKGRGAHVLFVARALPPHLAQQVQTHGHVMALLPPWCVETHSPVETTWTHTQQMVDAHATLGALATAGAFDWLVVDHYAVNAHWEMAMRQGAGRILALDDLSRVHDCNVLVDQNYDPDAQRYAGRVPAGCVLLLGPHFALLRPEFSKARQGIEPRDGPVRRLLIFLGGMDADNVTQTALEAVELLNLPSLAVDVVIGATHSARAQIEAFCARLPGAVCHVQVQRMAALCAAADLAVGAGGSASWERCALGLPTLALCLADNQRKILDNGSRAGLFYASDGQVPSALALAGQLLTLMASSGLRNHLSRLCLAAVDGEGCKRVASHMFSP